MSGVLETKDRILNVAEELFGEEGVDRVSVRDVTERAGVNVAAINYHFGSKEELIAAVFMRRLGPLNAARLELLTRAEREAGAGGPTVEKILEAFILPAVSCCQQHAGKGAGAFAKLMGRCLAENRPEVESLLKEQFTPIVTRFEKALMKALPGLSRSDVYWRLKFTFGALHHWLVTREKFLPAWTDKTTTEEQVRKLIGFTAAGFRG
jgi:AcrR family transcriptional regulator